MNKYKDWIVRFYASHKDIPKGHRDCETLTELVRCKDCKHYEWADNRAFGLGIRCDFSGLEDINDFDYCSKAERKEECTQ